MFELYDAIKNFKSFVPQEISDKAIILEQLETNKNCFYRENLIAHFTASAWIVNKNRDKVLMVYHNLFDSYSWTGGHADGELNLPYVALREVKEETGLSEVFFLTEEPFSIEVLTVDGHFKNCNYVPSHLHLNISYLFEADETMPLKINPKENSDVKWIDVKDIEKFVSEKWMFNNVYSKLIKKVSAL